MDAIGEKTVMVKFPLLLFSVMSRARNLKGNGPTLFVREDMSQTVRSKQKGLLQLKKLLRADNKRVVIRTT